MKKVLIIITTQFVPFGGLTTVMMNYYRNMNLEGLHIDFASTNEPPYELLEELYSHHSSYYKIGNRKRVLRYMIRLWKLIRMNKYNIVHVNGNSASMAVDLLPAAIENVSCRIAHVHSSGTEHPLVNRILLPVFKRLKTFSISASQDAGEWLFKDYFKVLNNAIDTNKYKFSEEKREQKRKEIGVENKYVIGTVGKITDNKNHMFLLDIYRSISHIEKDVALIIVGDGPLRERVEEKCSKYRLNNVMFLGMREDVDELLQAFDYFVFPSKKEGFGMALLEAQASGLMCLASNSIPDAVNISGHVNMLDLNEGKDTWAECILKTMIYDRKEYSEKACSSIIENGFDILTEADLLRKIYISEVEGTI